MMNGDSGSVEKKRHRKTNPGTARLRERKLMQELDAADTLTDENDDITSLSAVWKKKRAALQLHARETSLVASAHEPTSTILPANNVVLEPVIQPMIIEASLDSTLTNPIATVEREDLITKDKLLGALALMELSGVEVITTDVLEVGDIIISNMDSN